jgi:ribosomal protein S18 acetylase RimI-like enzyme
MILETGTAQPEAISLYESAGYTLIPGFGHYRRSPLNRCYARRLVAAAAGAP